jgi:lantibiotic biosynthesis protein
LLARAKTGSGSDQVDVMGGNAGAIPALISLAARFPDLDLVDTAARFGEELIESAHRSESGWCWRGRATPEISMPALTGFSHGAAGIGHALMALYRECGDKRFRTGATEAFRYENQHFDQANQNWPDFRNVGSTTTRFPIAWCHGAAGIGLSRLMAFELTGEQSYRDDTLIALSRTTDIVEQTRGRERDLSLCHGTFGRCELLLAATPTFREARYLDCATKSAESSIESFDGEWPCGVRQGEAPGLMLGLAGIGYFYLRIAAGAPSILAL